MLMIYQGSFNCNIYLLYLSTVISTYSGNPHRELTLSLCLTVLNPLTLKI